MSHLVNKVRGSCLWKTFALSLTVVLLLCSGPSDSSVYHNKGKNRFEFFCTTTISKRVNPAEGTLLYTGSVLPAVRPAV